MISTYVSNKLTTCTTTRADVVVVVVVCVVVVCVCVVVVRAKSIALLRCTLPVYASKHHVPMHSLCCTQSWWRHTMDAPRTPQMSRSGSYSTWPGRKQGRFVQTTAEAVQES